MIKKSAIALLSLLLGFGAIISTSAHAQMQQGYDNVKPDVTVDRSALEDLKNYTPPPMFGGDLMPPSTNRLAPPKLAPPKVEARKGVTVTPPSQPVAPPPAAAVGMTAPTLTAPNAEALLSHPTQNFHVLTERNASMTAPDEPVDSPDGPLLPLPDDEYTAMDKAKAAKAKADKQQILAKSEDKPKEVVKKDDKKKTDKKANKKKDEPKKEKKADTAKAVADANTKKDNKPAEKKTGLVNKADAATVKSVTIEAPKMVPPNPNAYKPKAPQSMPAIPPIKVEKNALPPMSGSPLPALPPTNDTAEMEKPSVGVRMMDAALERQMESDETKIKEQLAETNIKTVKPGTEKVEAAAKLTKQTHTKASDKTLIFANHNTSLTDKMKGQIKNQILPELQEDKKSRIQILSFATAPDQTETSARRISLLRSLAVRDYLKSLQIDTSRIDVRALPSQGNSVPPDKVDIVLLK